VDGVPTMSDYDDIDDKAARQQAVCNALHSAQTASTIIIGITI
jgi:hypothetical protein